MRVADGQRKREESSEVKCKEGIGTELGPAGSGGEDATRAKAKIWRGLGVLQRIPMQGSAAVKLQKSGQEAAAEKTQHANGRAEESES